jgi:transposase
MGEVFCGIDWAEDHHDVAVVDRGGRLLAKRRISDDPAGYRQLLELLVDAGDDPADPVPVAIETPRGLLVAALRATGRKVFAINPRQASYYRERHGVVRKKSDHADALMLANILRTDMAAHRPMPADSELAQAVAVLARAQQDAVWDRTQATNKLRSLLREYYPAALAAFMTAIDGLASRSARMVLTAAPTPAAARKLTVARLETLLRKAGRQRGVQAEAVRIHQALRAEHLRQSELVEDALGHKAIALLRQLGAACASVEQLTDAAIATFEQHPDAEIYRSFPGVGALTGARLLGEIGDDRTRFVDARGLKAFAGAAPVTRASGRSLVVHHRQIKNQRLALTGYLWAFSALTRSPGARVHYDRRRAAGDRHVAAQRNLFNRLLGCLFHCLQTGQCYAEHVAFTSSDSPNVAAA